MNYPLRTKLLIACGGALAPILLSLFTFDAKVFVSSAEMWTTISFVVRNGAFCVAACIIVWLSPDAKSPSTIFQLGIAAPAILTSLFQLNYQNQQSKVPNNHTLFGIPAIIDTASAEPVPLLRLASANDVQIRDCKQELTRAQQILKGLFGSLPAERWFVVISSNRLAKSAVGDVEEINLKYSGRFKPTICGPSDSDDRYRVVLGNFLDRDAASKLRDEAIAAGFSNDIWLWSPVR